MKEIKNHQGLKKEIWYSKDTLWGNSKGHLVFVDSKNIVRYNIALSCYDDMQDSFYNSYEQRNRILLFSNNFRPKHKITYSELINKGRLLAENLTIGKNRIFYEDEKEAFEITANSVSQAISFGKKNDNEFDPYTGWAGPVGLTAKYDKDYNTILFKFQYEYKVWRKGTYLDSYVGAIALNKIQILLSLNASDCVDPWF